MSVSEINTDENVKLKFCGYILPAVFLFLLTFLSPTIQAESLPHAAVHAVGRDFGYLPQKCEVSHRFYVNNEGSAPLTVTKIKPGCSCTSVSKIEAPIAPGDSAAVDITFKTGRYHHNVKKTTRIFTDDRNNPELPLTIRAYIVEPDETTGPVALTPPKMIIRKTDEGYVFENETLTMTNNGTDTLAVAVVHPPEKYIAFQNIPDRLPPCGQAVMRLTVREGTLDNNPDGLSCSLSFTDGDTTIITVPLEIKR